MGSCYSLFVRNHYYVAVWSFFISGCCVIRKLTRVDGGYSRETTTQNLWFIKDGNKT